MMLCLVQISIEIQPILPFRIVNLICVIKCSANYNSYQIIPLPVRGVHGKFHPHLYRERKWCNSVTLCAINGALHLFRPKKFTSIWANVSKNFLGQGQIGPGPNKQWFVKLSQPFYEILVWKSKLRLKIKIQNKIFI